MPSASGLNTERSAMRLSVYPKPRFLAIALLVSAGFVVPAPATDEGMFAADQVSLTSYVDYLDNHLFTHDGDDRGPSASSDLVAARNNIVTLLQGYGLSVTLEPFSYGGSTYHNVVATKTGTLYPSLEYIIGAHYDSVDNPGADDNARGVALVLESARILSQYDSAYTIRFVAFSMEEVGLVGSEAYVIEHAGDSILGMISADMVAFDTNTNVARVYGRSASAGLKAQLRAAISEYGDGLTSIDAGTINASDHAPFEDALIPACLLIEGEVWNNPHYHEAEDSFDTPNYLDFDYAVRMTRGVVGWLVDAAEVAVPVDNLKFDYPDGLPEYVSPAGGDRLRVEVSGLGLEVPQPGTGTLHVNTGGRWMTFPMEEIAPNVYDAIFPAATCGNEVRYYFSATAQSGLVYIYPRSAPASCHATVAAYGDRIIYAEPLDVAPTGWIAQGQWAFGQPTGDGGTNHGGPDPTSGHTGLNVFGFNLNGDYPAGMVETHLTSPALDCTDALRTRLRFWRWLGVEQPSYDHAYVRAGTNGVNFTTIWENPAEIADTAWIPMELDVSAIADGQAAVQLRWTMGQTDGSWQYCGWNIDDIEVVALSCTPPPNGDHDVDGDVDLYDTAAMQRCFGADGTPYPADGYCPPFDFDADGDADLLDYAEFCDLVTGPES